MWISPQEVGYSHRLHCQKGPAEVVLSSPAEEVQPATGLTETVLLRHHWIHPLHFYNCLVQLKSDLRRLRRVVRTSERIIGTTLPTLQELYLSRVSKRLVKSLWTPLIQHTPSLNCYRLVDATELWAPERPDTGTVSSLRQYTSWTLNNKSGTHNYNTLSIHHTHLFYFYFLISNLHILDLYIHSCIYSIYYILCFCCFVHCLFGYLYIILLLFVSCPVAVFLLHCGASVTTTNSLYV